MAEYKPTIPQNPSQDEPPFRLVWRAHHRFENRYDAEYNGDELQISWGDGDGYRFMIVSLDCPNPHETVMLSEDLCSEGYSYPTLEKALEACHRCYSKGEWRKGPHETIIGWDMGLTS